MFHRTPDAPFNTNSTFAGVMVRRKTGTVTLSSATNGTPIDAVDDSPILTGDGHPELPAPPPPAPTSDAAGPASR